MSIPRNTITKTIRNPNQNNTETSDSLILRKNILSEKNTPEDHGKLVREFKTLMVSRNAAYDAKYMRNFHQGEIRKLEREIKDLSLRIRSKEDELAKVAMKIHMLKLPENAPVRSDEIVAYNKLINKKYKLYDAESAINAELVSMEREASVLNSRSQELHAKYKKEQPAISLFHKSLHAFFSYYSSYKNDVPPDSRTADETELFSKIDRYLVNFKNETATSAIETRREGNSFYVDAFINGSLTGNFIFDTGAEFMTITESFAHELGLAVDLLPNVTMIVADGSRVTVKEGELFSVALGDSEVGNIPVLVVPDSPGFSADGLLGMAFLKNFTFSLNGTSGKIELTKNSVED